MKLFPALEKLYTKEQLTAREAQDRAEFIAWGAVVFQVSRLMVKFGVLDMLRNSEEGMTREEICQATGLSDYAVKCMTEASLCIGTILVDTETNRFTLSKTGWFLLNDPATRVNMDFNHDVNYQGWFHLEEALKEKIGIKSLTSDILITLNLERKDTSYTNAGELLADKNNYRGIDIVRFGESINIMLDRASYEHESILKEYKQAIQKYRQYYQHEEIQGATRNIVSQIPEEAFREAIANALVRRVWNINSQIKISMYDDRIEVVSPGGLPQGLSKEEYLSGQISILRNPIIANVFFRLGLIEQFGTGIRRINNSYRSSLVQPQFEIFDNSIKIILPVLKFITDDLSNDEKKVYQIIHEGADTTKQISQMSEFGRTKVLKILRQLEKQGYIRRMGEGRATKYILSK